MFGAGKKREGEKSIFGDNAIVVLIMRTPVP
jgi:hypothetical protein